DPATAPASGAAALPTPASPTSGPDHIDRRRTAKRNATTAPCSSSGPTPAPTPARPPAAAPLPAGSTSTITTGPTAHYEDTRQSAVSPTCVGSTPSHQAPLTRRGSAGWGNSGRPRTRSAAVRLPEHRVDHQVVEPPRLLRVRVMAGVLEDV